MKCIKKLNYGCNPLSEQNKIPLGHNCTNGTVYSKINFKVEICSAHQLCPRYEGQLMSDGGAYSPFQSILLVITHDYIITCVYGPTGSDGHERIDADAALRTILMPFEAKGVRMQWRIQGGGPGGLGPPPP